MSSRPRWAAARSPPGSSRSNSRTAQLMPRPWSTSRESWRRDLAQTDEEARSLKRRLAGIELTACSMADAMQFGFLLDGERRLLSVGYRTAEGALDPSCYDLLASEARLASFEGQQVITARVQSAL